MNKSLLLAICVAVPAAAQDVVPGLALTIGVPAKTDTIVYRRTVTKNGSDSSAGTRTVIVQGTKARDGSPQISVVQRFPGSLGVIVDTAIADARSFRALAHRSHQTGRTLRFTFKGDVVEGEVTTVAGPTGSAGASGAPTGGASSSDDGDVELVSQPVGGPVFDSNVIEMVVASMPLAAGFTTDAPFYIYEKGGRVPMKVAVKERASDTFGSLGARDAWVVTVAVPGAPATIWVDSATRAVLRVRYDIPAAKMSFTDERSTPLTK